MKRQADKEVGGKPCGDEAATTNNDIAVESTSQPPALDKNRMVKKFCLPRHHGDRIASAVNDARFKEEARGHLVNKGDGSDGPDIELQLLSDKPIVLRCHCEEEYYSQWLLYWPHDQAIGEKLLRWLDEMHSDHIDMVWALQWVAERPGEDHSVLCAGDGGDATSNLEAYDSIKVLAKLGIASTAQLGYLRFTVSPLNGNDIWEKKKKHHTIALETLNPRLFVVDCHAFE